MFQLSKRVHHIWGYQPVVCEIMQPQGKCGRARLQGHRVPRHNNAVYHQPDLSDLIVGSFHAANQDHAQHNAHISNQQHQVSKGGPQWTKVDWNRTPLAQVEQQALVFINPANRLMWAAHVTYAYTLDFAPSRYWLLWFWNTLTGGCLVTGTCALYPEYCKLPTISEGDCTVAVTT